MALNGRVVFNKFMSIPSLVRAMQCTQFCAKSVKDDLKPTDFLKRNFYFEMEGVYGKASSYALTCYDEIGGCVLWVKWSSFKVCSRSQKTKVHQDGVEKANSLE